MYVEIFFHGGLWSMHKSAKAQEGQYWKKFWDGKILYARILLPLAEKKQRGPPIFSSNIEIICIALKLP
jgi:hypothetical protein